MINVVCAIILKGDKVFAAQRSEKMNLPLKWEFPGGKVKAHETEEESLMRELMEELNIVVRITKKLTNNIHHYPQFTINLIPYIVEYVSGEFILLEHKNGQWLDRESLQQLDWADADIPILNEFLEYPVIK